MQEPVRRASTAGQLEARDRNAAGRVYALVHQLAMAAPAPIEEVAALVEASADTEVAPVVASALAQGADALRAQPDTWVGPARDLRAVLDAVLASQPLVPVPPPGEDAPVAALRAEAQAIQHAVMSGWRPVGAQQLLAAMHAHPAWTQAHRSDDLGQAWQGWCAVLSTLLADGVVSGVEAPLAALVRQCYAALAHAPRTSAPCACRRWCSPCPNWWSSASAKGEEHCDRSG